MTQGVCGIVKKKRKFHFPFSDAAAHGKNEILIVPQMVRKQSVEI
jgi:hypothetical protein